MDKRSLVVFIAMLAVTVGVNFLFSDTRSGHGWR